MNKKIEDIISSTKRNKAYAICVLLAILTFVVVTYYLFTYGLAYLHGDVSISSRYARAMEWSHQLFPDNWYFVNADIYSFRITSFAAFISLITGNHIYGRVIADELFLLIIIIAIVYLYKRLFESKGASIAIVLFLLFLGGVETRNMILNECTYSSEMLAIVLTLPLMFKIVSCSMDKEKKQFFSSLVLYGIILVIMVLCGVRYIAEHVLPMVSTIIVYQYISYKKNGIKDYLKSLISPFVAIGTPFVIGWIIYKWVCSTHYMNAGGMDKITLPESFGALLSNIQLTIITLFHCFGIEDATSIISLVGIKNVISVIVCILVCLVIPILQIIKYKSENKGTQFFIVFAICHNGIMLAITTILDKNLERYLLSSIYVCILLSARYIYVYWLKNNMAKTVFTICFFAMSIVQVIYMINSTKGWDDILQSHMKVVKELEDRGYEKGYGGYWTAFNYELYSNNEILFGEVDIRDKAHPHLWNLDYSVYEKKADSSFLILTDQEMELLEVELDELFGECNDSFVIDDVYFFDYQNFKYFKGDLYVFEYNHDIVDDFADGIADGKLTVKDLYFAEGGMVYEDGSCYVYSSGYLMGPYTRIDVGTYDVCYRGENVDELVLDIHSTQSKDAVNFVVNSIEDDCVNVTLVINEPVDIDFRAYVGGVDPVRFQEITVKKL